METNADRTLTKIEAVIFDFGGVLMRTGDPAGRREWEQRIGLAPGELIRAVHGCDAWRQAQLGRMSVHTYWETVAGMLGIPATDIPQLRHDFYRDDTLDPGLMALIDELRRAGCKVGLLSNDSLTLERKLRRELAIADRFDAIVISAQIGVMKPTPEAYAVICRVLAVEPCACIFIDDMPANVEGAEKIGMHGIQYRDRMDVRIALKPYLDLKGNSTMTDSAPLASDTIKSFVLAAHGNLAAVQTMLAEQPALLNAQHDWGPSGLEDAIGAAAHVGNRPIAEFLLAQGAQNNICVAAMLGKRDQVSAFLDGDPALANARGAHGITLMFHAAMSGEIAVTSLLHERGSTEGYSHALHGAIAHQHPDMVAWLLANGATDPNVLDYAGKTPLERALEHDPSPIADLLRANGGKINA